MSDQRDVLDRLQRALLAPTDGVVGLVDELLAVSMHRSVQLLYQVGHCHISLPSDSLTSELKIGIAKPVVRAALARVAFLCGGAPYRGEGVITSAKVRVVYMNSPDVQSLVLSPAVVNGAAPLLTSALNEANDRSHQVPVEH